jgi:hypothetical protein
MPKNRVLNHQGRSMYSYSSIPSGKLFRLIGTASAPALIDVRTLGPSLFDLAQWNPGLFLDDAFCRWCRGARAS